jgi:crossover junction endodeoxyribonuclease RuvC
MTEATATYTTATYTTDIHASDIRYTPNIIAIDPGLSGAIAILYRGDVGARPLPIAGKTLDLVELATIIQQARPTLAIVEKVHAMPGQGVTSMFTFGTGYGAIQGILATLRIPYELVTPQAWKKAVLAGTAKDKDAAIAYCRRAFPTIPLVLPRCRKAHDGIADALCLLEYGRRLRASH